MHGAFRKLDLKKHVIDLKTMSKYLKRTIESMYHKIFPTDLQLTLGK